MRYAGRWILAAVFAVQLAVPGWTIVDREITLSRGETFRFRTTVVDPYDAFRGRYVRIGLVETTVPVEAPDEFPPGVVAYATIGVDDNGYARFDSLEAEPPAGGAFIKVRSAGRGRGGVRVRLPLDRYYMNEGLAPEAERIYREHSGATGDAYVDVAVRRGSAVIEGLYIEGEPIEAYVRRLAAAAAGSP